MKLSPTPLGTVKYHCRSRDHKVITVRKVETGKGKVAYKTRKGGYVKRVHSSKELAEKDCGKSLRHKASAKRRSSSCSPNVGSGGSVPRQFRFYLQ